MKLKKLLVLSSALILTFAAGACSNGVSSATSSSSETPTPASSQSSSESTSTGKTSEEINSVLSDAASYLWQLYKSKLSDVSLSGDVDVVSFIAIGDYDVDITWTINQTKGTKDVLKVEDSDNKSKTIVTGYYDGKVEEEIEATIVPTLTFEGVSKTLEELTSHSFNVKVAVLKLGTYEDWQNLASDKKTSINIKGVVTAVNTSDGSIVFENEEHGYFGYKATNGKKAKVGDTIIYSGTRSDYNGQEEFASGGSYAVVSSGATVTPTDATADFKAAAKNNISDTTLGSKYQNKYITLKNCKPTKVDTKNGYYYFTVDGGKTEYYVFSKTSYLSDYSTFIDSYSLAKAAGRTFDYTGITTIYSQTYTFYGVANNPEVIKVNGDAITDKTYVDVISDNISALFDKDSEGNLTKTYEDKTTIDFSDYKIGDASIDVTLVSGTTATVEGTKVTLTPIDADDVTNVIEVTVTKGKDIEKLTISLETKSYLNTISDNILELFDIDSEGNATKTYDEVTTIDFSKYVIGDATITVGVESGTTATVEGTKLTLTPSTSGDVTNKIVITISKGNGSTFIAPSLTTEKVVDRWTSDTLTYKSFTGLTSSSGNATCSVACAKDETSSVNATVSFVSGYAQSNYKEWTIAKGGSMTITAPTGYKIKKVIAEAYKSVSATVTDGTNTITGEKDGTGANKGPVYTWKVNGSTIKFDVPSKGYTQSFYNMTIVLVADTTVTL